MPINTITTRAAHSATPSPFSLKAFEEVLHHMERTIALDQDVKHMPHLDYSAVESAGEATADAWVATEASAFAFLRAHAGATAVPLLIETVKELVSLLDIETGDHPTLSETMEAAIARRASAPRGTDLRNLLDRALPLLFGIASMQAAFFERDHTLHAA
ncbi:hypothetical protein [Sulfitobacter sp. S223]|uniref:hypothetical protein n=1 Tax=Sulfitobacter sp. S223 TaxID=2867023 RepID=UPI0021A74FDA|nr:hypothetical protein [Sulfitobacter sp. S223]UWR27919.1 hypothetical protein K3757_08280 [Sulfitobacter sp. S223]